ncbi:uncharacterized protein LOC133296630 [Gastrolobium bilobum]|uniref:uncharacterized protein LOC133296630 n=1 Tax=Gastrolobium bilobum TaxID=150636 RepID=UPI002AB31376|nr:uncharacterized protein LOC133296630 [Gastrolobium bilobum]
MALSSKNKLCFIDGSMKIPSKSDDNYSDWERCNNTVLEDAWNDLKDRFSQADIFRISDLEDDICKLEQGNRTVAQYFTELKILWDEVDNLIPLPRCICQVQCSCGGYNNMRKIRDRGRVIRFLKGLNNQYEHVSSQIMLIDPIPVVNKVFSMIIQQERKLSGPIQGHAANSTRAFSYVSESKNNFNMGRGRSNFNRGGNSDNFNRGGNTNNFNRGGNNGRGKGRFCTNCKMTNHTIESCYFKHGFPPGYKSKRSVNLAVTPENTSQTEHSALFTAEQHQ